MDESETDSRVTVTGLAISDLNWRQFFERLARLRQQVAARYGIRVRDEWHAHQIWSNRGVVFDRGLGFTPAKAGAFFRDVVLFTRKSPEVELFVASLPRPHNLETAWSRVIQRFENDLSRRSERGIVIADNGHDHTYRKVNRRMMAFNSIPSKVNPGQRLSSPVQSIIEDPFFRDSKDSYVIQLVDVLCWVCRVRHDHTPAQRKFGVQRLYKALRPVLKVQATRYDPYGFVIK